MDVTAYNAREDPFAETSLAGRDDEALANVWNWCAIKGCSGVTLTGRLYMKKGSRDQFRCVERLTDVAELSVEHMMSFLQVAPWSLSRSNGKKVSTRASTDTLFTDHM